MDEWQCARAQRRYSGFLAAYFEESGGGVMCESSETFRISDSILKFRMCVMGMSKICKASERLECRLLKENNIKGEQPERCEGSEVLHLFDNWLWLGTRLLTTR